MDRRLSKLPPEVEVFIHELSDYPWFEAADTDINKIKQLIHEHQTRLKQFGQRKIYPLKIVDDWKVAHLIAKDVVSGIPRHAQWNSTRLMIMKSARVAIDEYAFNQSLDMTEKLTKIAATEAVSHAIYEAIEEIAVNMLEDEQKNVMLDISWAVAYDISRSAVWNYVEGKMGEYGYENPFAPLMEIYKMGLWPMGLIREKALFGDKRSFAVFIPKT